MRHVHLDHVRRCFLFCVALAGMAASAAAAASPAPSQPQSPAAPTPARTIVAFRLKDGESIVLDGRLDETVWTQAEAAADFVQQDPDNGQPATEQTEVRIAYDNVALYLGVKLIDSSPDGVLGYQLRRDGPLVADDRFMWTIDTYLDAQTAYYFEMNPSGMMGDALVGSDLILNRQWDGIWTGRVAKTATGWTIEVEIPFRTLSFKPDSDTWGINFQRTVRRKNEESLWSGWARNQGLQRMTNAGRVTGIEDASQGRGLDIKPYGIVTSQSSPGREGSPDRNDADAGVDVFYSPMPGLRATLTVNTDFAQAEVDQRQLNLTRFPLFFPEKRDFFLDGAPYFEFNSGFAYPGDWTPFFSRRIGLNDTGQTQKIDFGGKLTGRMGSNDFGVLQVQTGEQDGNPSEAFTVVRLKRRFLRQSYVGGLYTRRATLGQDPLERETRYSAGLDFRLATATFLGSQNLSFEGFYLTSNDSQGAGENSAYAFYLYMPNDPWLALFAVGDIQENYDAPIGYIPRAGFLRYSPFVSYSKRPREHPYIRRLNTSVRMNWLVEKSDNRTLTRETAITALMDLHSGDTLTATVTPNYERLESDFRISPGITLPTGREYSFTRYRVQVSTASRRVLAVVPSVEWGPFYSGDRLRTALDLTIRVRAGLIASLASEWNQVDLAEGSFNTRLHRAILETPFSPWISLVNTVQYDTQSYVLGWQSRFRWILRPGTDIYAVYSHNWQEDPAQSRFSTLDRRATSKILYTYRF